MAQKRREPAERVVKRAPSERKRLSPELEAFAAGDDDAIWRRTTRGGRVHDPRLVALIPGVKNSDARLVYEAHVARIRRILDEGNEARLAEELAIVHATALYRAHSIVGFDVFAEAVLGLPTERATELVRMGRRVLGLPPALTEAEIAIWLRAEAGLLSVTSEGRVEVRDGVMTLSVPLARAAEALAAVGFREAPIAKSVEGPRTVIDRPKGMPRIREIEEREGRGARKE